MHQQPKRSRLRILAIGALVGSVLSVGVATSDVSADVYQADDTKVERPIYTESLRSGIRW